MVDDISRMQKKTRSASICATTGSIETTIYSNSPLADGNAGTPNYRRRRPATRTQSARITTTSSRSVRRRTPNQPQQVVQQNLQETRSYCTSEPRLSETETPPQRRKLSQRRPQQHATPRKSNAFLDVPTTNMHHLRVSDDDEDVDRLRTFSSSKGGVINRGDSFRRRRSRSNSLAPISPVHQQSSRASSFNSHSTSNLLDNNHQAAPVDVYRVIMLGAAGVGKQALISQFRTSDCINAYDGPECDEAEQNISIILNGIESELKFSTGTEKDHKDEWEDADAYIVVYSCIDKESFTRAKQIMSRLQDMDLSRTRPIVLVANKIDLARSRAVSAQDGKCLACTFGAKFIEVSVGINHNCDELLAGTLTQIRLKKEHNRLQGHTETSSSAHWYKSRSVVLASMKARQMLTWILGKEDSKFKHCENFQVL